MKTSRSTKPKSKSKVKSPDDIAYDLLVSTCELQTEAINIAVRKIERLVEKIKQKDDALRLCLNALELEALRDQVGEPLENCSAWYEVRAKAMRALGMDTLPNGKKRGIAKLLAVKRKAKR